eukprot:9061034-Lingulodinium_polyedra.AAC.1
MAIDRQDVQLEVNRLASDLKEPTKGSFKRLKRLVRYLAGTRDLEIHMRRPVAPRNQPVKLKVFSDSDW